MPAVDLGGSDFGSGDFASSDFGSGDFRRGDFVGGDFERGKFTSVDLERGELELTGRITTASNATFVGTIDGILVVYKPVAGERPLWDFPDGDLARRETAAYLVSESFGWNVVPRTWLRDGPLGTGMVQLWQDIDAEQDAVDLVFADAVPEMGWRQIFNGPIFDGPGEDGTGEDGTGQEERAVSLIHEDSLALRRMAVFDIVVNNADRKGAHILPMADGHRHGVDHGLTFHVEHKLRTVLWGWLGEDLNADELDGIDRVRTQLTGELGEALARLLSTTEIAAFAARCDRLRSQGRFPAPFGKMPAVPWPLF